MKSIYNFGLFSVVFVFSFSIFAASGDSGKLSQANESYNAGDCKKALSLFSAAQSEYSKDETLSSDVLFKKSYCQINLGQYPAAEAGFASYLKKNPGHDEAQLRLGESQFHQNHFEEARANFEKVNSPNLKSEAKIFSARSSLELNRHQEALTTLNSSDFSKDWTPVVHYWKGVVYYRMDDNDQATKEFKTAKEMAEEKSWVKNDAQGWLDRITRDRRWFMGYVTLGALSDSNLAQSASNSVTTKAGPEGPQGVPPIVGGGTTISDTGTYLSLGVTLMPYTRVNKNVTASLSYSSPFYTKSENKSYNYRVTTWELASNFKTDSGDWWGLKGQFLRTYYDTTESEGYVIGTPYYSWNVNNSWNLRFEYSLNSYTKTTGSSTQTPSVSTYYGISDTFGLKGSVSYVIGKGDQAVYKGANPPTVSSGNMFSNYTTSGASAGWWYHVMKDLDFSGQAAYYKTAYNHEDAPPPSGSPAPSDRSDVLTQYSLDLAYTAIENRWLFDLSGTISKNKSEGYQGLPTYGSLTTYTYDRNYYLLTTTVLF